VYKAWQWYKWCVKLAGWLAACAEAANGAQQVSSQALRAVCALPARAFHSWSGGRLSRLCMPGSGSATKPHAPARSSPAQQKKASKSSRNINRHHRTDELHGHASFCEQGEA
jgi:hypothetical protein